MQVITLAVPECTREGMHRSQCSSCHPRLQGHRRLQWICRAPKLLWAQALTRGIDMKCNLFS